MPSAAKTSHSTDRTFKLQTEYVLEKFLKRTFEATGSSLDHVVKAQVFLTNLDRLNAFDQVWKRISRCRRRAPRSGHGAIGKRTWSKSI